MADPTDSGIYEIVNLKNGKRYVGSAHCFRKRWHVHRHHLRHGKHHSRHLQKAWVKHGEEAFEFRVLQLCPVSGIYEVEQDYLDLLKPAYNICRTARGGGGGEMSEDGRARVAESNRRRTGWTMSDEGRAQIAASKIGNTATKGRTRNRAAVEATASAHRGMKRSDETRARISAAMSGKSRSALSQETRAKISAAGRARPLNLERVAKMAATKRGSKLSAAHKAAIGAASKVAWERRKAGRP